MSENGAMVGDRVEVSFGDNALYGTVMLMPYNAGDSWVIHSDDGSIYHVQTFQHIRVLNRRWDTKEITK